MLVSLELGVTPSGSSEIHPAGVQLTCQTESPNLQHDSVWKQTRNNDHHYLLVLHHV